MVPYCSPEDLGLSYEQKNPATQYFESSCFWLFKIVPLFSEKNAFKMLSKIYGHMSHLCQQTGTIKTKFHSPHLLIFQAKSGSKWPVIYRRNCLKVNNQLKKKTYIHVSHIKSGKIKSDPVIGSDATIVHARFNFFFLFVFFKDLNALLK